MRWLYISGLFSVLFMSCISSHTQTEKPENEEAKRMLQGLWLDELSDETVMNVMGDTIYYSDILTDPVYFKVIDDSLLTYGSVVNSYKILKQGEYTFEFLALSGDEVHLHKAEQADSVSFIHKQEVPIYDNVLKKDSVVYFNDHRYHGYVYINPSHIKVTKPTVSETGMGMDNFYYDNIIHICVYEGKDRIFSKDITKQMFESYIPHDFFQYAILSDMDFNKIDSRGYHFQANLCVPDDASCYLINLIVSPDGQINYELVN